MKELTEEQRNIAKTVLKLSADLGGNLIDKINEFEFGDIQSYRMGRLSIIMPALGMVLAAISDTHDIPFETMVTLQDNANKMVAKLRQEDEDIDERL